MVTKTVKYKKLNKLKVKKDGGNITIELNGSIDPVEKETTIKL